RAHAAGRQRTAVRVASVSLAVLATSGVIGGIAANSWTAHSRGTAQSSASAQTPLLRPESAVTRSGNISYKIKVTEHSKSTAGAPGEVSTGAFDPATDTGYLRTPYHDGPGFSEQRLINGTRYLGSAGVDQKLHWNLQAGKHTSLDLVS